MHEPTKGPYRVLTQGAKHFVIADKGAGAESICVASSPEDARLFAASWELLEALKALDSYLDFSTPMDENVALTFSKTDGINSAMAKARAAIKKADGVATGAALEVKA